MPDDVVVPTVRELRRRWKPVKEGPAAAPAHEALRIRLHRCFSWMHRAEIVAAAEDADQLLDAQLLWRWIALNALYGRWDDEKRWPAGDRETLRDFTSRIVREDVAGRIGVLLERDRRLVEALVGNAFLVKRFWEDPERDPGPDPGRTSKPVHRVRTALRDGLPARALHDVIDRVHFLRCQLAHGAATFNGRENRTAVRHANRFLELLLPEVAIVIIDHAWDGDWGGLCYPPLR